VKKFRKRFLQVTPVLLLSFVLLKLLYGLPDVFDLSVADEAFYLNSARTGVLRADGFLYLLWLRGLLGVMDPISAYYTNLIVLIIFFSIAAFLWFRVSSGSTSVGLILAVLMTVSTMNTVGWPYITRLSAAILMLAATGISIVQKPDSRFMIAMPAALILSYIRPEFAMAGMLFGAFALYYSWRNRKAEPKSSWVLAIVSAGLLLLLIVVSPVDHSRSMVAFSQHYALDLHEIGMWPEEPWATGNQLMERDFPGASSFVEAMVTNPAAVIGHVWRNALRLPFEIIEAVRPYWLTGIFWKFLIALSFTGLMLRLLLMLRPTREWKKDITRLTEGGILLLFLLPLIVSILIIYPRQHYLIMILPIVVGFGVWRLKLPVSRQVGVGAAAVIFSLFFAYWMPWTANLRPGFRFPSSVQSSHGAGLCTLRDRVDALNLLKKERSFTLLSPLGMLQPYLNEGWTEILHYAKSTSFLEFLARESITAIWVNSDLMNDVRFRDDDQFKTFLLHPPAGWRKVGVSGCSEQYLLILEPFL
jgi:hypothetical protein